MLQVKSPPIGGLFYSLEIKKLKQHAAANSAGDFF